MTMKNGKYVDDYGTVLYYKRGELHREDGPAVESKRGTKAWWLNGEHHREDGPAIEYADGSKEWFLNGKLHREDGPAVEDADGSKEWWVNDKRHREDGPAIEYSNGTKMWYINGELHREDGPAIEGADGSKEWWVNGEELTEQEFNERISHTQQPKLTVEKLLSFIKDMGVVNMTLEITEEEYKDYISQFLSSSTEAVTDEDRITTINGVFGHSTLGGCLITFRLKA